MKRNIKLQTFFPYFKLFLDIELASLHPSDELVSKKCFKSAQTLFRVNIMKGRIFSYSFCKMLHIYPLSCCILSNKGGTRSDRAQI